jgi:hypothetical protein|tara:strand:+ start:438 stop:815 length:378 start_codon:yes stop_codon:yes gene_type:complete
MAVIEGKAMFVNVKATEVYEGKDTGRYTVTLTLNDETADELSKKGVRLKSYGEGAEAILQRKFASKFPVRVIDAEGEPFSGDIPSGSTVRISYKYGDEHPVYGVPVYMDGIRVLEMGAAGVDAAL